ncbi:MAG: T9SS type A sorting domain-containing protein [Flavobacteriales bacterium]|jgi:hypothetical protein|nr:T9SS type A sorting domain-containing protein [Flavobacteriales bacterium]
MKQIILSLFVFLLFPIQEGKSQNCNTSTLQNNLDNNKHIISADFNGDGYEDIVLLDSLGFHLSWMKNSPSGFSNAERLVGGAKIEIIEKIDFNNDGKEEILFGTSSLLYYMFYTGTGSQTSIEFKELLNAPTSQKFTSIAIADFDKDGYDGFVIGSESKLMSSFAYRALAVFNTGTNLSSALVTQGTYNLLNDLAVGDISGNGYPDVAISGYSDLWFENLGNKTFGAEKTIASAVSNFARTELVDANGDSKLNLLEITGSGKLQYYKINTSGSGTFYYPQTITTGLTKLTSVFDKVTYKGKAGILTLTDDAIYFLDGTNNYNKELICDGINGLEGAALVSGGGATKLVFSQKNGSIKSFDSHIGLTELDAHTFWVSPNPAKDRILLNIEQDQLKESTISDEAGRILLISSKNEIDIQRLPKGIYFIHSTLQDGTLKNTKLVKE